MRKILAYTFYRPEQITYRMFRKIKISDIEKFYLGSLNELVGLIKKKEFDYVLGLGDYRKDSKSIRIEKLFKNQYGKQKISETGLEYYGATWDLSLLEGAVISKNATNGPCNRSAYQICQTITENNLRTKYAFIHIPSSLEINIANQTIERWLTNL